MSSILKTFRDIRWRAVLAVFAGFLQQGMSWGLLMVYGSQYTYFRDTLFIGYSRVQLAAPGAFAASLVLLGSVLQGRMCDNHWHRRTNLVGSIFLLAGLIFLALGSGGGQQGQGNYTNVMLSYLLQGLGQSTFFVSSSHIAASWYPQNPGLPIGITSCGVAILGIIWPLLFTQGTASWGFPTAVGAMAVLSAVFCAMIVTFGVPNPEQTRRPIKSPLKLRTWIDPAAVRNLEWCFVAGSMCFIYLALLGLPQFLESWAKSRHLTAGDSNAVVLLTVATGSSLVGRLIAPRLGDRYGYRIVHAMCNFLIMIIIFAFWPSSSAWSHGIAFAVLFGIFQGAIIALPPADVKEVVDPRQRSAIRKTEVSTAVNSQLTLGQRSIRSEEIATIHDQSHLHKAQSDDSISQNLSTTSESLTIGNAALGDISMATLAGVAVADALIEEDEAVRQAAMERRAKLGGWLGAAFLCASPFAVAGPLATSQLVGIYGIESCGWWTGACYGASGVCLLLSVFTSRHNQGKRDVYQEEKV